MDQEVVHQIIMVAFVAAIYALCIVSTTRMIISIGQKSVEAKSAMLSIGLFAAAIIGCILISELAGSQPAMVLSVGSCAFSSIIYFALRRKWTRDEAAQRSTIDGLAKTVDVLRKDLTAATTPEVLCAQAAKDYDLTRREEDMLLLLSKGCSYAEISQSLYLSQNTVKSHIRNLYKKMGAADRTSLRKMVDESQD